MATEPKTSIEIEKYLPPELQTDPEELKDFEPGSELSKEEVEELVKFMIEELGVPKPLESKN